MTLTEQWKKGELEALNKLIKQIKTVDDSRALSDEYLEDRGLDTRRDYDAVCEWGYGVTWIIVDYVLPYLKRVQELKEFADYSLHNRDELTRQINFWMDKHTQIEKENQQLKKLLRECRQSFMGIRAQIEEYEYSMARKTAQIAIDEIDNAIGADDDKK